MDANMTLHDFINFEVKEVKDLCFSNAISTVKEEYSEDYKRILLQTTMSIKTLSNSYYKTSPCLENSEIDQIKNALRNYRCNSKQVNDFKETLIADLTDFQSQINTKYVKKLAELEKEKKICERQIQVLDFQKHKLVMERLSKIEWPYDNKTKEFDNKITSLQTKIQNYEQKIAQAQKSHPLANEKDILMYQIHLKEKYLS